MSTVYDVAVVGSRGFLGSATVAELERRGANIARFTLDQPFVVEGRVAATARAVVWAVGYVTPADTARGDEGLGELGRLIDAARRSGNPPHVVLLSSGGAVYGPPSLPPFSEQDDPSPANDYGRIKLAEEQALIDAQIPHTVLRISNPYGPAQVSRAGRAGAGQGVVGYWLAAVRNGDPVTLFGDGSVVRDYVFVEDAAAAIATATERVPGGVINIGSGVGTSLAELLEVVSEAVAPQRVEVHREPARGVDPAAAFLAVDHARAALGWSAQTSLVDGISRTWAAVKV